MFYVLKRIMSNTVETYLYRDCLYTIIFGDGVRGVNLLNLENQFSDAIFISFLLSLDLNKGIGCLFYRKEQIVNLYLSTVPLKAENLSVDIRHWKVAAGATLIGIDPIKASCFCMADS